MMPKAPDFPRSTAAVEQGLLGQIIQEWIQSSLGINRGLQQVGDESLVVGIQDCSTENGRHRWFLLLLHSSGVVRRHNAFVWPTDVRSLLLGHCAWTSPLNSRSGYPKLGLKLVLP